MRLESDLIGAWVHVNAVPIRDGVMRINSSWRFDVDGRAVLAAEVVLEHNGQAVFRDAESHTGRWSVLADTLVVELPDHTDSPFRLSFTERGELTSGTSATWRRSAQSHS